ncbi:hypothetical protein IE4872_5900599 [Rhizobium gallicum]|uniref:Uncharacterized protein n=1 Tax=Rhizobium gallicum TaxID=56730 RepID=A0A1L5NEE0_9HYPH|nr:hypothetical protein IE4872_5900599 [Rhizobium gallicum]
MAQLVPPGAWRAVRDIPATTASATPFRFAGDLGPVGPARACPGAGGRDDGNRRRCKKRPRQAQAATASPSARPRAPATGPQQVGRNGRFAEFQPFRYRRNGKTLFVRQSQYLSIVLHTRKPRLLPSRHSPAPLKSGPSLAKRRVQESISLSPKDCPGFNGIPLREIPKPAFGDDLREKRLVRVLPSYCMVDIGVMVVYPGRRHPNAKERVMVDFLAETSRGLPASDQGLLNPRISHPLLFAT